MKLEVIDNLTTSPSSCTADQGFELLCFLGKSGTYISVVSCANMKQSWRKNELLGNVLQMKTPFLDFLLLNTKTILTK